MTDQCRSIFCIPKFISHIVSLPRPFTYLFSLLHINCVSVSSNHFVPIPSLFLYVLIASSLILQPFYINYFSSNAPPLCLVTTSMCLSFIRPWCLCLLICHWSGGVIHWACFRITPSMRHLPSCQLWHHRLHYAMVCCMDWCRTS